MRALVLRGNISSGRCAYSVFAYAGRHLTGTGPARLLPTTFSLHDVNDVEAAARKALARYCVRVGAHLGVADTDDAVAYLVAESWVAAERFDVSRGTRFSNVLYSQLSFRTTDWFRLRFGRTKWTFSTHEHIRERPLPLSLDAAVVDLDGRSGESLRETLEGSSSHLAAASDATTRRLLAEAVRQADDDQRVLREGAARIIKARAARAWERQRQKRADLSQIG